MSENAPIESSLSSVLRENASLIIMYLLGMILVARVWWPLGWLYLAYCVLSNVLYMAWVCPYCPHYTAATCRAGYHLLSARRFRAKAGRTFGEQFGRNVIVLFPGWFVPPVVGMYLLVTGFSWRLVILLVLFCLVGFVLLPADSQRHCTGCENLDCPRRKAGPTTADR